MKVWTVTIVNMQDIPDAEPWTASFSTYEKARAFRDAIDALCILYGISNTIYVSMDSGSIDDIRYISMFMEAYAPKEEKEEK